MTDTTNESTAPEVDFEATLQELESLVKQMESGKLGLEESLTAFERGVKLSRKCQAALKNADLRVRALTDNNGFEAFDTETAGEP